MLEHDHREVVTNSFTLAVLPDTQIYTESYPHIFTAQTQWIANNRDALNIAFVLHEGDITNGNIEYHWRNANHSMGVLDNVLPYAMVMGNHDMGPGGDCSSRESMFNDYFPKNRFGQQSNLGGTFDSELMGNSFHLFSTGISDWLVIALEYLPREQVLEWANDIVASHWDRRVIILTHSHVHPDNSLFGSNPAHHWNPNDYGISSEPGSVNNGEQVWDKFIRRHSTISLALSGHFVDNDGTARVVGTSEGGNQVHQMLANYQHRKNGGNGYLRLLECVPSKNQILVRTYSPYLDSYLTNPNHEFTLSGINLGS